MSVGERPADPTQQTRIMGQPGYAVARVVLPAQIEGATRLWLTAEAWNGERHKTSWPLAAPH